MKKSLSKKLNIFRTSPLIGIVAIIEVILLICVSTFAWFVFADNNKLDTDIISVEPDSGLEIDFSDANDNDYINIWNYLNEFQFEPVTSLDGRNIFIPTSGTFNATDTSNIKFREATVNDMNSKYINIDFTLSNTSEEDMPVFLNSKSYFRFADSAHGKALRLAFYQNDGSSGKVTSSLLSQEYDGEEPTEPPTVEPTEGGGDDDSHYLVYFDTKGSNWSTVWVEADFTSNADGNTNKCLQMTQLKEGSTIYYIDLLNLLESNGTNHFTFMKFRSNPNNVTNETVSVELKNDSINPNTVYCFTLKNGSAYVGSNSYGTGYMLDAPKEYTGEVPKLDGDGGSGGSGSTEAPTEAPTTPDSEERVTVYFYNTLGWNPPYAYIWQSNDRNTKDDDIPLSSWPGKPMNHISGSIYYYTFNAKYDSIIFNDGNSQGGAVKTGDIYPVKDGHIYMIGNPNPDNTLNWEVEDYVGAVDGGTYPVISPGVSTGFQRPYAPVIEIDNNTGSSKVVIPAFASSIDDYNYGSNNPLFTIKAGQTMSLSMIVWLEGTDPDCTEDVYAGKDIDMNLIFATKDSGEEMYTYKFLDKTKENWIDDKVTTDTGVSFKPVIQLYDVDNQKGYMMSVHDDEEGKPTIWQCIAPADLINSEHIIFRRVNPMNEDEVWNYWDTDGFKDLGIVNNSVVTFSAFSDGAPTSAVKEDGKLYTGAPAKSCGGLWGDHKVQTVTVYDGTNGQWIKNSDLQDTLSVLTMSFEYIYPDGKTKQTIEYKASGATDKGMYYFVVPHDVYSEKGSNHSTITFKRYYNFNDDYALNSDKNQLTYHMSWSKGSCKGKFFEINGNKSDSCYWGSDMLYVQTRAILNSKIDSSYLQAHFSDSSGNSSYIPLYKNNYYAAKNDGYGYACVIPSDNAYTNYIIERCDPNNHYTVWNATPKQTIDNPTSTDFTYSNTIENNICTIDYMFLKVYLECSTSYCGDSWDPEIYLFKGDTKEKAWPGNTMTWTSNTPEGGGSGYKQYVYEVNISKYDTMVFSNDYDYGNQRRQTGNISIGTDDHVSGMIYQWDASNQRWRSTHKSGVTANETLHVTLYDTQWDQNS